MRILAALLALVGVLVLPGCADDRGAPVDVVEQDATDEEGAEAHDPDHGAGDGEGGQAEVGDDDPDAAGDESPSTSPSAPHGEACEGELREAIIAPVEAQLEAFAAGDTDAAYDKVSEDVRSGVDLATFGDLVRQAYPEVFDPDDWSFGPCSTDGDGQAVLAVDVTGSNGRTAGYTYLLIQDPGGWAVAATTANTPPDDEPAEA